MAQVNSEPGKNQTFANATYTSATVPGYTLSTQDNNTPGQQTTVYQYNTIVPYAQVEPGTPGDKGQRPGRS
jgi:hypothetical protein